MPEELGGPEISGELEVPASEIDGHVGQDAIDDVLLGSPRFSRDVITTALTTVAEDLPAIKADFDAPPVDWNYALLCCSAATSSGSTQVQDSVLRIIQACIQSPETATHLKESSALLLERSGNRPAIDLAANRDLVPTGGWTHAPPSLRLDVVRRRLELGVPLHNGGRVNANSFQRDFWSAARDNNWLSVSAPTSAGKSFIVKQWFLDAALRGTTFVGVYVVPTRALIEEVSVDLARAFPNDIAVLTMPWDAAVATQPKEVYVLTQERLHLLQQLHSSFAPDVVFVDEAHKIGDGTRGVLLQQVLDEAVRRRLGAQVLFASPLTTNPEILLGSAPTVASREALTSALVTVNQNLIWADQVRGNTRRWTATLMLRGEDLRVGEYVLPDRPNTPVKRLSLTAVALGRHTSGNVVYCNGAAEAEKIADQIYQALGADADLRGNPEIEALRELAETAVHDKFALGLTLTRGVAFHYGNMPLLLKTEIERLFRKGLLTYLVCTSTLLEGVNLPCRNLFVRAPRKGNGNPMTLPDFWNLAGRAGRWGKEFQGNIVCVDAGRPGTWTNPPRVRTAQPIVRAADGPIQEPTDLISLMTAGIDYERGPSTPTLEAIFNFLASRVASGISLADIPGLPHDDPDALDDLETIIEGVLERLDVPPAVLARHTGISPVHMDQLHGYFKTLNARELTRLRLPGPADPDAASTYQEALGIVGEYLAHDFGSSARRFQLSLTLVQWMRGYPLARIIGDRQFFLDRNGRPYTLASLIRNVMGDVEKVARFEAPKYLACYLDLLHRELTERGLETDTDGIDVEMMLELGVSRITDVSWMSLGLSRGSVLALSDLIVDDDLTPDDCRAWLLERDVDMLNFAVLVLREIRGLKERLEREQSN